jgi:hypothetical protein
MDQKLSELNVLASAKPNAYLLVIDPDEVLDENKAKRINLSTLSTGGSDNTNFGPYDPDKYYSKDAPDYVSYSGNTYEYINATPAKGKTPNSQPTYWKLASSGAFTHNQNSDTSTNSRIFEIGKRSGTELDASGNPVDEPIGEVVLVFGGPNGGGGKVAIRHRWEDSGGTHSLQQCLNYGGTLLDHWDVIGSGGGGTAENPVLYLETDPDGYTTSKKGYVEGLVSDVTERRVASDGSTITAGTFTYSYRVSTSSFWTTGVPFATLKTALINASDANKVVEVKGTNTTTTVPATAILTITRPA